MTKDKKVVILAVAATAVFGLMAGCGKPTPISISKDVVKAMDKVKSTDGNIEFVFNGQMANTEETGLSMDFGIEMNMDFQSTVTPESASYIDMNMKVSALSMNYSTDMESYMVKKDGEYISYTLAEDAWTKQKINNFSYEMDTLVQKDIYSAIANGKLKATLDDKLQKVNEKDAYLLHVTLDGDYLDDIFSSIGDMSDGLLDDVDFSKTEAEFDIYIYKDANVPAKLEVDLIDMADAMMEGLAGEASLTVDEYAMTVTMNSYNTVEPIKVPDIALRDAVETDDSQSIDGLFGDLEDGDDDYSYDEAAQNENGDYIIKNYDEDIQAVIGLPENYAHTYSSDYYFYMEDDSDEYNTTLGYEFDDFSTMEESAEYYSDFSYTDDDYSDIKSTPETTVTVNGMEIHYTAIEYLYMNEYSCIDAYAWTETSTGVPLVVEIEFFPFEDSATATPEELVKIAYSKVVLESVK